jgi:toxin YhaV
MASKNSETIVNGWELRFSAVFVQQFTDLRVEVENLRLREKDPESYRSKKPTKRFLMLLNLVYEIIPQDPERSEYRQGDTLGMASNISSIQ